MKKYKRKIIFYDDQSFSVIYATQEHFDKMLQTREDIKTMRPATNEEYKAFISRVKKQGS